MQRSKLKVGEVYANKGRGGAVAPARQTPAILLSTEHVRSRWKDGRWVIQPCSYTTRDVACAVERQVHKGFPTEEEANAFAATVPHAEVRDERKWNLSTGWNVSYTEWVPTPINIGFLTGRYADYEGERERYRIEQEESNRRNAERRAQQEADRKAAQTAAEAESEKRTRAVAKIVQAEKTRWAAVDVRVSPHVSYNASDGSVSVTSISLDVDTAERVLRYLQDTKKGL